jgi:hypothetical protein
VDGLITRGGNRSSARKMTADERAAAIDLPSAKRSSDFLVVQPPMQVQLEQQTHNALFDEYLARRNLPGFPVYHIACAESIWEPLYALIEGRKRYEEGKAEGHNLRPVTFVHMPEANHIVRLYP